MPLILSENDIKSVLTMEDAIQVVEEGFRHLGTGRADVVPRWAIRAPDAPGVNYLRWFMPATMHEMGIMGAKILVSQSPGGETRLPSRFYVVLHDSNTGQLLALMHAQELSKIRTGAVTGVGIKYLARKDSTTAAVFGSAAYAPMQVVGVCAALPIEKVKIFSPTPANRQRFAGEMRELLKRDITAVDSSDEAVEGSDIIVTISNAHEPVLRGDLIPRGTHVTLAGSSIPTDREADDQTLLRSDKIVVELMEQTLKESGDLVIPMNDGVLKREDIYCDLSDIVSGQKPGRTSNDEITLFKFNGMAIEDVACAAKAYEKAVEKGVGVEFSF